MAAINASFLGTLSTRRSSVVVGSFTTRHCRLSGISIFVGYAPGPYPSSQGVRAVTKKISPHAAADSKNSINSASLMDDDQDPKPIVIIDQDSEPGETVLILSFGERLGALIDTIRALKDLGLNVVKGSVQTDGPTKQTTLHITVLSTGRKVEDPDMLERIRLTVINNLLKFHPESSEQLAMGEAFGVKAPVKKPVSDVATRIHIQDDGPKRSLLCIEMADRSGLLLEIIKNIADMNLEVESAEIDTEGLVAKNKFHVSYHGAALKNDMARGLVNCLRYYLRRPQTDEDSY